MTRHPPELITRRLSLRPFRISDAPVVQQLAGAPEVYATTTNIPHPYEDGMAERWIATHASRFYEGEGVTLAITRNEELVGAVGLIAAPLHRRAELGYWIGVPYWGKGYATEAAAAIIRYGFETLSYHKIMARHFKTNPASGRVMAKAGMTREGELVDDVLKDGSFHTTVYFGLINPGDAG